MTRPECRPRIRELIASGDLSLQPPRHFVRSPASMVAVSGGAGAPGLCLICGQVGFDVVYVYPGGRSVGVHDLCRAVWIDESMRNGRIVAD